jgi:acetyl esterase/lipase
MTQRIPRLLLTLVGVSVVLSALPAAAHHGKGKNPKHKVPHTAPCVDQDSSVYRLDITVKGVPTFGYYALPNKSSKLKAPAGLVVFAHGYGHTAESWREHITRTANTLGVVAVVMEYRGLVRTAPSKPGGLPGSRGWPVQAGAEDTNAAAQLLERTCGLTAKPIMLHSVSLGSNAAGLALAMKPTRSNGKPLFDRWVNVEGAVNVVETYFEAQGVAPSGNAYAKGAVEDIEREMGGTFQDRSDVYAERTVVNRVDDIVASGVKSVVLVHGVGDGLVPYNQARELNTALVASGMPTDFTTVTRRTANTAAGTTLDGYATGNVPGGVPSPFAGHGSEIDATHDVIRLGFERLADLLAGTAYCGEGAFDGDSGSYFAYETC